MVILANWKDQLTVLGSTPIIVKRGQFTTSLRSLAGELKCSKQTVINFLCLLEATGMIQRLSVQGKFTIITIVDYDNYQPIEKETQKDRDEALSSFEKAKEIMKEANFKEDDFSEIQNSKNCKENDSSASKNEANCGDSEDLPRHTLDRKQDHILDHKEKDKNCRNKKDFYSSYAREENKKSFEKIKREENFWQDTSQGLAEKIPKLRSLAEKFFGERLAKNDSILSEQQIREHLFNWLRNALQIERNNNNNSSNNGQTTKNTPERRQTSFDSRRGVDAPPQDKSSIPRGRF